MGFGSGVGYSGCVPAAFVVAFVVCFDLTCGLYFHLKESERKCFIEELPGETLVTGKYNLLLYDDQNRIFLPANRFGVQVSVTDPKGSVSLNKIYVAEGRFVFTSHLPGEHVICIGSNSSAWYGGSMMRIHLHFTVGPSDYFVLTNGKRIPELQLRVSQLLDQVEMIRKEQEYQRIREEAFRDTSESTHRMIWACPLLQCIVFGVVGFIQVTCLRMFFLRKKII